MADIPAVGRAPSEPIVAARGLLVGYAEDPVCPAITLTVRPGEALAVVGQNGSGKSTLLRTVTGLLDPLGGVLTVLGRPVDERSRAHRAAVAVLGDDDVFFPALTVEEHLLLVARGHLVPEPDEVVEALLEEFGIADHATAFPRALSSGQRRRLLLAAVFARPRSLLILDEPEQRLDTTMRLHLAGLLAEEREHGGAVLFACHDPAVVGGGDRRAAPHTRPRPARERRGRRSCHRGLSSAGRDLRRLTRALSARNVTSTWADLLTSVYMAILTLVLTVATVWWSARELLADRPTTTPRLLIDPSWLAVLAALWFLALVVAVVSRVGPVALPRPEASWWLPIPVERRTLLRPAGATWLAVTAVVAAAAGVTLAGGLGAGMPTVALAGLVGAGIGALAVGVLALDRQPGDAARRGGRTSRSSASPSSVSSQWQWACHPCRRRRQGRRRRSPWPPSPPVPWSAGGPTVVWSASTTSTSTGSAPPRSSPSSPLSNSTHESWAGPSNEPRAATAVRAAPA